MRTEFLTGRAGAGGQRASQRGRNRFGSWGGARFSRAFLIRRTCPTQARWRPLRDSARQAVRRCWSLGFVQCSPRSNNKQGREVLATVFIEARPKDRPEGSAIEDYVFEEQGDRVLKTFHTQGEAIIWAKSQGHSPHVARVRHLNDKKIPDHWRPV
jgi:hypothetical protein